MYGKVWWQKSKVLYHKATVTEVAFPKVIFPNILAKSKSIESISIIRGIIYWGIRTKIIVITNSLTHFKWSMIIFRIHPHGKSSTSNKTDIDYHCGRNCFVNSVQNTHTTFDGYDDSKEFLDFENTAPFHINSHVLTKYNLTDNLKWLVKTVWKNPSSHQYFP